MDFKIVDDTMSKEELEALEKRDYSKDLKEARKNGSVVVADGWDNAVKAIKAKRALDASKTITIRVPVRVIERYKKKAASVGIGYQTLMKEMLEAAPV